MQLIRRTKSRHQIQILADNSLGCFVGTSEPGTITIQLIGADGNYALAMPTAEAARLSEELAEQIANGSPARPATIIQ